VFKELDNFIAKIDGFANMSSSELIDYFVYFLTEICRQDFVKSPEISQCFNQAKVQPYSNISSYLSLNSKRTKGKKKQRFLKMNGGYTLELSRQVELAESLQKSVGKDKAIASLDSLSTKIKDQNEKSFHDEAVICFKIGAHRASIVMTWLLTVHHLCKYIQTHHLPAFDAALAKEKDRRIKLNAIKSFDDFSDIPEAKLIELARAAGIISNDVRKILDEKLGTRNSSAHPSNITISEVKSTEFIIDLVENVIFKFSI
jgi:hypothetical protein